MQFLHNQKLCATFAAAQNQANAKAHTYKQRDGEREGETDRQIE